MDKKIILNLLGLLVISAICAAVENPNVGSPFKPQNAPAHSGRQQRFTTRSNPYGRSGNDIVTGNVGGGKHFRGVVPYGSSYYSSAYTSTRGSASVNNFMRRSANPIADDRNPGRSRTYTDPRRSVSSMRRPDGTSGLSNPHLAGQGRKTNPYIVLLAAQTPAPQYQRPLSTNNMDLEQILTRRRQLQEETEKQAEQTEKEPAKERDFFDVALKTQPIQQTQEEKPQQADPASPSSQETGLTGILTEHPETPDEQLPEAKEPTESEGQNKTQRTDRTSPESDLIPKLDTESLNADRGREVLGEHETFASLAREKFSNFMAAAETFVKDGQFYKAADTYALAAVWKPEDPRGYLGQSFSLLAAGEYMSSAYYLSRAFKLDSKTALKKYNLAEFIDNRDVFESRILEISTWQERSGSGELAFLLAYISYQDGKATRAVQQIRKAKEAMPNSQAVSVLKHIIDPEEVLK